MKELQYALKKHRQDSNKNKQKIAKKVSNLSKEELESGITPDPAEFSLKGIGRNIKNSRG